MLDATFCLGVAALLATPGPTNTLFAASGALAGGRRSLGLVPVSIVSYWLVIGLYSLFLGEVVGAYVLWIKVAAILWLLFSAVRLWGQAGDGFATVPTPVSWQRIALTTALNPKALIFATLLFGPAPAGGQFLAFGILDACIGLAWIGLGKLAAHGTPWLTPGRIGRVSAVVLVVFAAVLLGSTLPALAN